MKRKAFLVGFFVIACLVGGMSSYVPISEAQIGVAPAATNPGVYPTDGLYSAKFTYSVEVRYSESLSVRLCVWNVTTHVFEPKGERRYSNLDNWEPLEWAGISFTPDFEGAKLSYRFEYQTEDREGSKVWQLLRVKKEGKLQDVFSDPKLKSSVITVQLEEGDVSPDEITRHEEVSYTVLVNVNKEVEIELTVYNPITKDWVSQARITYGNVSRWEPITWTLTPFADMKFCGNRDSMFKFKAYYQGEQVDSSDIYEGPCIFGANFANPKVTPAEGDYSDTFTYTVAVTNVTREDLDGIHLELRNPYSGERKDMGAGTTNETADGGWDLSWEVAPFENCPECEGMSSAYRFTYGYSVWPEYAWEEGPYLSSVQEVNVRKVEPAAIEYRRYDGYVTPVDITVDVNASRALDLELFISDPCTKVSESKGVKRCRSGNVTWTVTPFDALARNEVEDYIGKSFNISLRYDGWTEEGKGPELVAVFDNPRHPEEVIYNDSFVFSVELIAAKELNVTLQYLYRGNWTTRGIENNPQRYTNTGHWDTLSWNCTALYTWDEFAFTWGTDAGLVRMSALGFSEPVIKTTRLHKITQD
jgi:hypothetical protein